MPRDAGKYIAIAVLVVLMFALWGAPLLVMVLGLSESSAPRSVVDVLLLHAVLVVVFGALLGLSALGVALADDAPNRVSALAVWSLLIGAVSAFGLVVTVMSMLGPIGALLILAVVVTVAIGPILRDRRRREWVASGRCGGCGYDLRETPDRCPECGEPISEDLARRRRILASAEIVTPEARARLSALPAMAPPAEDEKLSALPPELAMEVRHAKLEVELPAARQRPTAPAKENATQPRPPLRVVPSSEPDLSPLPLVDEDSSDDTPPRRRDS